MHISSENCRSYAEAILLLHHARNYVRSTRAPYCADALMLFSEVQRRVMEEWAETIQKLNKAKATVAPQLPLDREAD